MANIHFLYFFLNTATSLQLYLGPVLQSVLQVERSQDRFPVSPGFFPWHMTDPCALGPTQPLKSEYQVIPGGKGGRCIRLITYHLHVPIVKKSGGLNLLEPCRPVQDCNGTVLPLPITRCCYNRIL